MEKIEKINELTGRLLAVDEALALLGEKEAAATIFVMKGDDEDSTDVQIGVGVAQVALEEERSRVARELKSLGIETAIDPAMAIHLGREKERSAG